MAGFTAGCAKEPADKGAGAGAAGAAAQPAPPAAPATIALIRAADWIGAEWSEDALKVGLSEEGMDAGKDYEFKASSAQGDLATLPNLIDAALDAKVKVIVTLQDATLQVAIKRVKDTPIVFHILSDPFAAGAGTSDSAHLPNVTGVYSPGFGDPEQERRIELIKRLVPKAKRVGVLFSPAEQLSVDLKDHLTSAAKKAKLEVVAVPVNSPSDASEATNALVGKKVDAIEIYGNAAHGGFESIIKIAKEKNIPVFSPSPFEIMKGATAALYPDFQEGGAVAGKMIARILRGESPAKIPFYRLETTKTKLASEQK
ncbi:MAG TPA: ABC transporter substrate-binding protein [Gemmatimonadales bacterium]|nr:ABC transporter substrate-binding protein [Gemmatimonadales bacterium]